MKKKSMIIKPDPNYVYLFDSGVVFNSKQLKLIEFVKTQHNYFSKTIEKSVRKYSLDSNGIGTPYWSHTVSVAELVSNYDRRGIESALCHDLFEDTLCDYDRLYCCLIQIGYCRVHVIEICDTVTDLTDVYDKESFPDLNRSKRKRLEAERLGNIPSLSQTVKYCDLIHNTINIVESDKGFAVQYLKEKVSILDKMRNGNIKALIECIYVLGNGLKHLNIDINGIKL